MQSLWQHPIFGRIFSFLLARLFALLGSTVRVRIVAPDSANWPINSSSAILLAFWHDQQIPVIWIHTTLVKILGNRPIHVLISRHNDGRLVANTIKHYGVSSVDGSSTSGGSEALLKMRGLLKQRITMAITPDGPRGPKHMAKRGIAKLALTTTTPIICVSVAAEKSWHFKSWDQMFLPKPFSRVTIVFGQFNFNPDKVSPTGQKTQESRLAEQLTDKLNELTKQSSDLLSADQL